MCLIFGVVDVIAVLWFSFCVPKWLFQYWNSELHTYTDTHLHIENKCVHPKIYNIKMVSKIALFPKKRNKTKVQLKYKAITRTECAKVGDFIGTFHEKLHFDSGSISTKKHTHNNDESNSRQGQQQQSNEFGRVFRWNDEIKCEIKIKN